MKIIQLPATLTSVRSLSDGGLSVGFHTQELSPEEKVVVMEKINAFGWLLFKDTETAFTEKEIPKEKPSGDFKSPSQRLRAVLFVLWQKSGERGDFEDFYKKKMEFIIEKVKVKIGELEL